MQRIPAEILSETKKNFESMGLRALVVIGGDGSLTIAQQLYEEGIPLVGVPKTIDNDLEATQMTFGFESAVSVVVDALDRLNTTAESHNRVMVLEVMGRYAGWIAGMGGIAGGAHVVLMPESPSTYESILKKVADREARGRRFRWSWWRKARASGASSPACNPALSTRTAATASRCMATRC